MINSKAKLCMGCGACANICPVEAITMTFNEKGFYAPKVDDEKCIKCGKCLKVCGAIELQTGKNTPPPPCIRCCRK